MYQKTIPDWSNSLSLGTLSHQIVPLLGIPLKVVELLVAPLLLQVAPPEQLLLAPEEFILASYDRGGPGVPECVLVQVQHNLFSRRLLSPGDGRPHVEGVGVNGNLGLQPGYSEQR